MREQILTFRPNDTIRIQTPMGIITLERRQSDGRKVKITMPAMMEAVVGKEKTLDSKLVGIDDKGKPTPKFTMLIPVTNEDGELIGVVSPTAFNLVEPQEETKDEADPPKMADVAN